MKLTKLDQDILARVENRAEDIFDLSDAVGQEPSDVVAACIELHQRRFVEWMYPDDPVSITDAGRQALSGSEE